MLISVFIKLFLRIAMKQRSIFLFAFASIMAFTHVLKAQKTAAEYFEEGVNKSKSGDFVAALQAFNLAITMSPENAPSYYNRAMAKANLKDHRGAILDFDRSIELNPKYSDAVS